MPDPSAQNPQAYRTHRGLNLAMGLTAGFSLISAIPFLAERAGVQFLPDPGIHQSWHGWMVGGAMGLAGLVFALLMAAQARGAVFAVLRVTAPVVYSLIFYVGLTTAIPMVWTSLAGRPAAMVVTVADPRGTPTSRCRPAVQLDSLPLLFDRLCNVPHSLIMTLAPGDKVLLIGKRSRLGVFYNGVRLLPRGQDV